MSHEGYIYFKLAEECLCQDRNSCWVVRLILGVTVTSFKIHIIHGLADKTQLLTIKTGDTEAIISDGRRGYFKTCSMMSTDDELIYTCHCSPACDKVYLEPEHVVFTQDLQVTLCEIYLEVDI